MPSPVKSVMENKDGALRGGGGVLKLWEEFMGLEFVELKAASLHDC
jgi:hypothetical protein